MKKMISAFLAMVMCLSMFGSAFAATTDEAKAIASSVVNTVTDASQVTSPFIDVVKGVQQSVVGVNNYQTYTYSNYNPYYNFGDFWGFGGYGNGGGSSRESTERLAATGSGVVVYGELVLTNYHVVEDASRVSISALNSEEELDGTVVAYDEGADVALIYVPGLTLAAVPLGDSDQLQVGEWAICIGNPLAEQFKGTVTVGIISALDRQINSTTSTDKYGRKQVVTNSMIQTDAAINSGNSGGGMFNVLGQLMGIPSQKYSGSYYSGTTVEGIGLAVPVNTAKPLIEEAIEKIASGEAGEASGSQSKRTDGGTVQASDGKPMLGVTITPITATNNYLVYIGAIPGGVLITNVNEGGPAHTAGLAAYDIIVEIDGEIAGSTTRVREALNNHEFGESVNIKIYRVEGMETAKSADELGEGRYIDYEVELFEFNTAA